jgi:hypothetical protein
MARYPLKTLNASRLAAGVGLTRLVDARAVHEGRAFPPNRHKKGVLLRRDGGTAMRHRIEAAQGRIAGRFTVDFGPPAISPVTALIAAFEALLTGLFAPVGWSQVTQTKILISFRLFAKKWRFWGSKIKMSPVIGQ